MTELKILKEIFESKRITGTGITLQHHLDLEIDLRAEAIKWINENYTMGNMDKFYDKDPSAQSGDHRFSQAVAIRNCIKHFFNITDEELK